MILWGLLCTHTFYGDFQKHCNTTLWGHCLYTHTQLYGDIAYTLSFENTLMGTYIRYLHKHIYGIHDVYTFKRTCVIRQSPHIY